MKHCTVSVINDLVTDQRVRKVCLYLTDKGFSVTLIGRKLPWSPELQILPYRQKRMKLLFKKGPLFYASFNLRLFLKLLFTKTDLLVSNDLDTLLPNFLVSKLKSIPLVYDSHEYFTEVPELQGRFARKVWLAIEKWIFPKLKNVFTVNESIAKEYSKKYGVHIEIVRNLPLRQVSFAEINPADFGLTANQKYVILQGSGINLDRGGEEAIMAMHILKTVKLLIVGSGDKLPEMKELVRKHGLEDSVIFIPRQSPDVLRSLTKMAEIGLSLDKDTNPNYRYSLPNKLFDYIQCGIPVLVSDLLEVRKIVETWQVGRVMIDYSIENIASMLRMMLLNNDKQLLKENLKRAAENLTWEQNIPALNRIYNQFLADA